MYLQVLTGTGALQGRRIGQSANSRHTYFVLFTAGEPQTFIAPSPFGHNVIEQIFSHEEPRKEFTRAARPQHPRCPHCANSPIPRFFTSGGADINDHPVFRAARNGRFASRCLTSQSPGPDTGNRRKSRTRTGRDDARQQGRRAAHDIRQPLPGQVCSNRCIAR